jgi:ubiquinone/menaquinone biosynthesis C-methylase UbiE
MSEAIDTLTLVKGRLRTLEADRVLDIGCGGGQIAGDLAAAGFDLTGIDPSVAAVTAARGAVPAARFEVAPAEHLPFPAAAFSAALFHNSLHHVPVAAMPAALGEAARVVAPRGGVIIVEPQASGAFFEVMRPIEDESAVRAAAIAAIEDAVAAGLFELVEARACERTVTFANIEEFFGYVTRVDPRRAAVVARERERVTRLFEAAGEATAQGTRFRAPNLFWLLRPQRAA